MRNRISIARLILCVIFLHVSVNVSVGENVKKSIDDNRDDTGENSDESKDESLDIPVENEGPPNITCSRRANSLMHEIKAAKPKQFPFTAAVLSGQHDYLCSGSVVSNGIILTTAKCTQQPVSYVLLNTTIAKKDDNAVMLHIIKSEKFPTFSGDDSLKDVGILYVEKHNGSFASKIRLSNFTSGKDISDIEAIGFGLNSDVGQPKQLQYVGLELRSSLEAIDILKAYFDCVDTQIPTCFKDTGSPAILDNELIGIVSVGQEECTKEMSSTYAINKKMADIVPTYTFKAWLDDRIQKYEEQELEALSVFPAGPIQKVVHRMVSRPIYKIRRRSHANKLEAYSKVIIILSSLLVCAKLL